jgi:thiol:disulfide interchange protein
MGSSSRCFHFRLLAWIVLCAAVVPALAQPAKERPRHVSFEVSLTALDPFSDLNLVGKKPEKLEWRRGETYLLTIRGTPQEGWYTYPIERALPGQSQDQLSKISLLGKDFVLVGKVQESEPHVGELPVVGKFHKFDSPFTWTQEVALRPDASPGPTNLEVQISYQACKDTCIQERFQVSVPVVVSADPPVALSPAVQQALQQPSLPSSPRPEPSREPAVATGFDYRNLTVIDREGALSVSGGGGARSGLLALIVTAIFGGLISLATPCVFPMIPITVSIFIKQSEAGGGQPLLKAFVYCGTLVVVLTIGGVALGSVLQTVAQHWITNLILTGVFVFFGLSLLGAYDITLPSWLSDATASGESKGGLLGIVFMALTFSVVSFACVGPIYGGFTALSATSISAVEGWTQRIVGPLAFSLAFASPFFILALFPTLLRSMPRSGSWMNSVKVTMGFLELAAAFKFVRAAEVNLLSGSRYFTFDLVMGIYVALALAAGLYLLAVYRLPHDHDAPESISVTRLVFGLIFLTLAIYLLPGTFKDERGRSQKPRGVLYEWTRAFLLPDDPSEWSTNLAQAMAQAEREDKPLFIDFTGLG